MSDTPRTDAESRFAQEWQDYIVAEEFAKKLERALNAETQAFSDYMTKSTIEANDLKHEIGNLRQHIELLREQNHVLGEEIGGGP